jgi:hypothetical protein
MNEAAWALVGVTFILAVLTGWYAFEAHRERVERNRLILTFQLIPWEPGIVKLRIQNAGNSAASNIKGTIESMLYTGTASISWSYTVLASGKYEEFGFPMPADAKTEEHFLKQLEKAVDFSFVNDLCRDAYNPDVGRPALLRAGLYRASCLT